MPIDPVTPRQLGYYFALSQVGLEMAAPIGLGYIVDQWLGSLPWLTIAGAVLGFVGGLTHLVVLSKRQPQPGPSQRDEQ